MERIYINLSFGVASLPENGTDIDSVLKAADYALYEGKKLGDNRVIKSKIDIT